MEVKPTMIEQQIQQLKAEIERVVEKMMISDSMSDRNYADIRLEQLEAMLKDLESD